MTLKSRHALLTNTLLLLLLFAGSVVVRWDKLNRPLSHHHEWLTAHMLMTLDIWDERGLSECHYSPIYTYSNPGDKFINQLGGMTDEHGDSYYVSYPAFGYLFPYVYFQATGQDISIEGLTGFSLGLNFIAFFFIWMLLYSMYNRSSRQEIFLPAYLGAALYLFSAGPLWFHSNVYFVDMLAQVLWIAGIYIFVKHLQNPKQKRWVFSLGILNFLLLSTEWIGVFFGLFVFIVLLVRGWKQRQFGPVLVIAVTTILAGAWYLLQFSSIDGFDRLIEVQMGKYEYRSGHGASDEQFGFMKEAALEALWDRYRVNYLPWLKLLAGMLGLFLIVSFLRRLRSFFTKCEGVILGVVFFSIIVHHLAFFNFTTMHDFSTLKTGVLWSVLMAICSYRILDFLQDRSKKLVPIMAILMLAVSGWVAKDSVRDYHMTNNKEFGTSTSKELGQYITENIPPEDPIVISNYFGNPQTAYYAKRNVLSIKDVDKIKEKLRRKKLEKAWYIYLDAQLKVTGRELIYAED